MTDRRQPSRRVPMPSPVWNLSARLLVLTVAFVMLGEVLIYVPSISRFRLVYLSERLAAAHEATLALEAAPDHMLPPALERELLRHAGVRSIALRTPHAAYLMLGTPSAVAATYDLRQATPARLIVDAFVALTSPSDRVLRVIGPARLDPEALVDVTLDEAPMRAAMLDYSGRILVLSIVLSLLTAALVYLSLHLLMVRPLHRLTENVVSFRDDPENAAREPMPSRRSDEIGVVQRELAAMQRGLRAALRQQAHLAALGAAVGKINHDLRNMLSSAVLISDRLTMSDDPQVRRQATALMAAIDRAIALCQDTLSFARTGEMVTRREAFALADLVAEVIEALALADGGPIGLDIAVPSETVVVGDRGQLFRALFNLARNAVEAMAESGGTFTLVARREGGRVVVEVGDSGPGLPERARRHLFEPFAGAARSGGTGLGLPIAREILRAHGGDLALVESDARGTVFRLELPAAPVQPVRRVG